MTFRPASLFGAASLGGRGCYRNGHCVSCASAWAKTHEVESATHPPSLLTGRTAAGRSFEDFPFNEAIGLRVEAELKCSVRCRCGRTQGGWQFGIDECDGRAIADFRLVESLLDLTGRHMRIVRDLPNAKW